MSVSVYRRALGALVLISLGGCGDKSVTSLPEPGRVAILLAAPANNVGGLLIRVAGPVPATDFEAPQAGSILEFWSSNRTSRVLILGDVLAGEVASFSVPDIGRLAGFEVTVVQVSGRDNELRPVEGYTLRLVRS